MIRDSRERKRRRWWNAKERNYSVILEKENAKRSPCREGCKGKKMTVEPYSTGTA